MNKKLKKGISTALICAMLLGATSTFTMAAAADDTVSVTSEQAQSYKIKKKNVWLRMPIPDPTNPSDFMKNKISLYFVNGADIPYMETSEFFALFKDLFGSLVGIEKKTKDGKIILIRESGYSAYIDGDNDIISFDDYNKFCTIGNNTIVEIVPGKTLDENGNYLYIKPLSKSTERYGKFLEMDLGSYGIDLVKKDDKIYIPLQTLSDVFLSGYNCSIVYNSKSAYYYNFNVDAFVDNAGEITEYGKSYYSVKSDGKLSKELTEYNYKELCFAMDHLYGLKEIHNFSSFAELCRETGTESAFLSGDSKTIDTALYLMVSRYIDDIHSIYKTPGYLTGGKYLKTLSKKYGSGRSRDVIADLLTEFSAERNKFFPDGVPAYQEVGDTAFITFDQFTSFSENYYENAPTAESADTFGIIAYSVQQILRKDSPIKNVVLDLSCNLGGDTAAAAYTLGAFLGKVSLSTADMNTGAYVTADYAADTNFDGKFNKKDYLAGKGLNLYCLESGISFSCGNLVPNVFKHVNNVSLIGQTSGGGSCTLSAISTAAGSGVVISSNRRLSFMKNGSFYDIDLGAEPDFALSKTSSFFDREKLVALIDSLL